MSDRAGGAASGVLTVLGALAVAGASAAPWAEETVSRAFDDLEMTETVVTRGVEFTRLAFPAGLTLAAAGIALVALGAWARRVAGVLVAVVGAVALVDIAVGMVAASRVDASLTAAPGLAAAGGVAVVAGGSLAARSRRRPGLPTRFDIDTDEADDEWDAAVEPDDEWDAAVEPDDEWDAAVEPDHEWDAAIERDGRDHAAEPDERDQ